MKPTRIVVLVLLALVSFIAGYSLRRGPGTVNKDSSSQGATTQRETSNIGKIDDDLARHGDRLAGDLRRAVEHFMEAADKSDAATVAGMYDSRFVNYRVTDAGDFVRLDRDQVLSFMARAAGPHFPGVSSEIAGKLQ